MARSRADYSRPVEGEVSLLRDYDSLVRGIVRHIIRVRHIPAWMHREDLVAAGRFGLLKAIRRSDWDEQSFESLAKSCIFTAVLDELRLLDWCKRNVRQSGEADMRRALVVADAHEAWVQDCFDHEDRLEVRIALRQLESVLCHLPPREREILRRYLSGQEKKQIAQDLGRSEARISQLFTRAIGWLRDQLNEREEA